MSSNLVEKFKGWCEKHRTVAFILIVGLVVIATGNFLGGLEKIHTYGSKAWDWLSGYDDQARLLVLPLNNLGASDDEVYAVAMTQEIIAKLSRIGGLRVVPLRSAMSYRKTDRPLNAVAADLGVEYVLEGTIQWHRSGETERIRVALSLLRATDEAVLWEDSFVREVTDIFMIQTDVAEEVVLALSIPVREHIRQIVEYTPTSNSEAYIYYLRGTYYLNKGFSRSDFALAASMFEKAVGADPHFASAHALLSRAHSYMYWFGYDLTSARASKSRQALEIALSHDPDAVESCLAAAQYFYYVERDYERSLNELQRGRKLWPEIADIYYLMAAICKRQGEFEKAIRNFRSAIKLDPLAFRLVYDMAFTYMVVRDYGKARDSYDRVISLAPDFAQAHLDKSWLCVLEAGDVTEAVKLLDNARGFIDSLALAHNMASYAMLKRDYAAALAWLGSISGAGLEDSADYYLKKAGAYALADDSLLSIALYDSARAVLEGRLESPTVWEALDRSRLGIALAGLGRREDAVTEGQLGVSLLPVSEDHSKGPELVLNLAVIYTMVGENERAIDQLKYVLSVPFWISPWYLELNPVFDPLRSHPEFQQLVVGYAS